MLLQECIPVGCVPSAAVAVCWGGVSARGCLPGGCLPGGVCLEGVCPGGLPKCMLGYTPPPVNRMTDVCENITFLQLRCGR